MQERPLNLPGSHVVARSDTQWWSLEQAGLGRSSRRRCQEMETIRANVLVQRHLRNRLPTMTEIQMKWTPSPASRIAHCLFLRQQLKHLSTARDRNIVGSYKQRGGKAVGEAVRVLPVRQASLENSPGACRGHRRRPKRRSSTLVPKTTSMSTWMVKTSIANKIQSASISRP